MRGRTDGFSQSTYCGSPVRSSRPWCVGCGHAPPVNDRTGDDGEASGGTKTTAGRRCGLSRPSALTTVSTNYSSPLSTVPTFLPIGNRPVPLTGGAIALDERVSIGGDYTLGTNLPGHAAVRAARIDDHAEMTNDARRTSHRAGGQAPRGAYRRPLSALSPEKAPLAVTGREARTRRGPGIPLRPRRAVGSHDR